MNSRHLWFAATLLLAGSAAAQTTPPASVDWRSAGAVTPVHNMGQCDSSWAFAAVAALEGAKPAARTGGLVALSAQELIDCSGSSGNHGCNGGSAETALKWTEQRGITTEHAYPYTARNGTCRGGPLALTIHGVHKVAVDLHSLMMAVAKQPVAVEIDGSTNEFHHYGGGVYPCHSGTPNFWVTIVGYGKDAAGRTYWIMKAPLGTEWGEHGYMRMTRSADCHNIFEAVVPLL